MSKHPAEVFGYPIWLDNAEAQTSRNNFHCPFSNKEGYELFQTRMESSTIDDLFYAFRNNPNIPSRTDFINRLEGKIQENAHIQLDIKWSRK